jgi:hypothetical protein
MRIGFQIAGIFIAVGLGALTVTLLHDPHALIPHRPYGSWIFLRVMVLSSLALLGVLLVFGVVDDRPEFDNPAGDRATFWRAAGFAFLISALASATFLAAAALAGH